MNRLTATERYQRDATFRSLVDVLEHYIHQGTYTPTELREAAILAATIHENHTLRRRFVVPGCDCRYQHNQVCDICQGITGKEQDKIV